MDEPREDGPRRSFEIKLRDLPVRLRNSLHYGLTLEEDSGLPGWMMLVDRDRLIAAVEAVLAGAAEVRQRRGGDRTRRGPPPPLSWRTAAPLPVPGRSVILTVCERGLSVRGAGAAMEIDALGIWASPIAVSGSMLRRVMARLPWERVQLCYADGRLAIENRGLRAREI